MPTTASLTTTVRNVSGVTKFFSFLPPHGRTLAAGETLLVDGDLRDRLARHKRKFTALNNALVNGKLALVDTPDEHYYDNVFDVTKVLDIDSLQVVLKDPSWGTYSSSES